MASRVHSETSRSQRQQGERHHATAPDFWLRTLENLLQFLWLWAATEVERMSVLSPSTGSWLRPQALSLRKRRNRLIVISNRLPVVFRTGDDGGLRPEPGSGGLVTALAPVLRGRGGIWIGWPGTTAGREEINRAVTDASE